MFYLSGTWSKDTGNSADRSGTFTRYIQRLVHAPRNLRSILLQFRRMPAQGFRVVVFRVLRLLSRYESGTTLKFAPLVVRLVPTNIYIYFYFCTRSEMLPGIFFRRNQVDLLPPLSHLEQGGYMGWVCLSRKPQNGLMPPICKSSCGNSEPSFSSSPRLLSLKLFVMKERRATNEAVKQNRCVVFLRYCRVPWFLDGVAKPAV